MSTVVLATRDAGFHLLGDILPRDKANPFLEGIRDHIFDAAIIAINDNPVMSEDFESAQARICEFKALLDGRTPGAHHALSAGSWRCMVEAMVEAAAGS